MRLGGVRVSAVSSTGLPLCAGGSQGCMLMRGLLPGIRATNVVD